MIKPTSSYKMTKATKFRLGRYKNPHLRGEMKRSWIQAELESLIKPKADKSSKYHGDE